jgi:hypothetical protein
LPTLRRISYKGMNTNWLVLKRLPVAGFEAPSDTVFKHLNTTPLMNR